MNEQAHTFCRDPSPVSHFTWCSTKRLSAAPACKSPCPLLPCSNTGRRKWPFRILVWGIHHWLLSDRVLDEWDHLSVAVWQSLGSAVTIWGFCLFLNISLLHHGMTLVFAERCIIINLQTSNVHKTGRNFLGRLWGEFFQPFLWGCMAVMFFPLQNKGAGYWRWDASALGFYWQIRKLWEWLKNCKAFFFLSEDPVEGESLSWKLRQRDFLGQRNKCGRAGQVRFGFLGGPKTSKSQN